MNRISAIAIWTAIIIGLAIPVVLAAFSPFLQWRSAVYITAGFAGIFGFVILAIQPMLIGNLLPGLSPVSTRKVHRFAGVLLLMLVIAHVGGLWIESPPDVLDALLFRSPTPFAVWGVVAMWAVFLTATIAALRKAMRLKPNLWRLVHKTLALIIVVGSVVHAYLVLGAMEPVTKALLCIAILLLTVKVVFNLRWKSAR